MTAKDIKRQDVIHGKTEWLLTTGGASKGSLGGGVGPGPSNPDPF